MRSKPTLNLSGASVSVFDAFVARLTLNGKGLVILLFRRLANDFDIALPLTVPEMPSLRALPIHRFSSHKCVQPHAW